MAKTQLFDIKHQLTFYGAYHTNKTNVAIHIVCVPILILTAQVFLATLPTPWSSDILPTVTFGEYLKFAPNWTVVGSLLYAAYYFALEPLAAILYLPQFTLSCLFAIHAAETEEGVKIAAWAHVVSWIAQFIGHGKFEGRAPALLDNLLGAVVLAPFFVHLELLFKAGYRPQFHREIINSIGMETKRFRTEEKTKKVQ